MIIDEVHNIRDEQGGDMRDAVKSIEDVIKYTDNLRLVLLTATPMYNRSTEIIWILNMMLLNDKRPLLKKNDYFNSDDELIVGKEKLLKEKCQGYVLFKRRKSYRFSYKINTSQLKTIQNNKLISNYPKGSNGCIVRPKHSPEQNLVGGVIRDKFKFLELFGSKFSSGKLQQIVYNKSIQNLIQNNPDIDLNNRGEINPILDNIALTQITNIVYPTTDKNLTDKINNGDITIDEFYGERGLRNCMNYSGKRYSYKKNIEPLFHSNFIHNYSTKLATILNLVNNSEGIVFIYTNYISAGIIPLILMLEHKYQWNNTDIIRIYKYNTFTIIY